MIKKNNKGFMQTTHDLYYIQEKLEDTKGAIRIRKSKQDRQHNGQKKKNKRTNKDIQNMRIKLEIE